MHKPHFFFHWLFNSGLILDFRGEKGHLWPVRFNSKDVLNGVLYRKPFYKQRRNFWAGVGGSFSPNKGQLYFPKREGNASLKRQPHVFKPCSAPRRAKCSQNSNQDTSSLRRGDNEIWRKQWKLLNDEIISAIFSVKLRPSTLLLLPNCLVLAYIRINQTGAITAVIDLMEYKGSQLTFLAI